MKKPSADPQQVLYEFFEFDESDLAANRLGAFSDKQKRDLKTDKKVSRTASIGFGLVLTVVGLAILFLLVGLPLLQGARLDMVDFGNIASSLLVPLVFLGIGISALYSGLRTKEDITEHSVGSVAGPVDIVEAEKATYNHPRRHRSLYELRVGGREFNVYPDLPDALIQGDDYAVYFDNADDSILSVEWISKG